MSKPDASDLKDGDKQRTDEVLNRHIDRLRMRHLRLLDKIALSGSLSAAAEAIGMSQPGATKMLQELEQAFGCKLIERSAKGGALTSAGQHVLERLRIALHSLGTARTALNTRKELPLIRLGIIPLVGLHALSHVVSTLQSENNLPMLQIELGTVESLLQELSEGRVDCVVGFLDETTALHDIGKFKVTPLWEEKLVIVGAEDHPLSGYKKISMQKVRDSDWILMPQGSSSRRAVERLFLHAGLPPPKPYIETASFHIELSLVAISKMLAAVPESAYRQHPSGVKILPMEMGFPSTTLVFATLAGVPVLPSVEMLAQRFQSYARSLSHGS